ncbi:MAG: NUDIX domain-containing protein [Patescibacteria group bacterium]|jgi:8-oxo-dGTP pyrophosphatase MutT (NUDIX family)
MSDPKYIRKVQTAVNIFIRCGDDFLMLHRNPNKWIDASKLNSIGGRVEPGENFLDAAIRETEEETGIRISPDQMQFAGLVKLEGGYDEDWVMCFFSVEVKTKNIPHGTTTPDGILVWLHKDRVLDSDYEVIDDLNYCFKDIVAGNVFFLTAKVNDQHNVYDVSLSRLFENKK